MTAPVPATRAGHCDCCRTEYQPGTPIVWDFTIPGWVLSTHRSAGSRQPSRRQPRRDYRAQSG